MEDKKAGVKDKVHPDLLIPPHIVDKLFQLLAGEWQPDPSQQEQLVAHLMACRYCRTALIVRLAAEQEDERSNSSLESSASNLFTRFVAIHHEIEVQDYEHFGAYAEAIVAEGQEKADKRFPLLAEHIKRCQSCKTTLEEILAFLNEPEEAD
jgi:hypothetical protein